MSLAHFFPDLVPLVEPNPAPQLDSTSQPTNQPQPSPDPQPTEPPIFTKGKRNSVNVIYNGYRHCGAGKSNSSSYFKSV